MTNDAPLLVPAAEATAFVRALVAVHHVPDADAATVAHCLVRADLRGVDTHGIARLAIYLERVERGLVTAAPRLSPRRVAPAAAHLDGQNGFGFVVATRAMHEAMALADEAGLGLVGVSNSTHFGMAANYLLQALDRGFAAMVFTNASPAMPPWGGREAMLGTSPFAAAFPNPGGTPFVLDMAPTVVARGKIRRAAREGRPIPEGLALDEHGRPTTDAEAALRGVMLPMAGPKGSGLSMLMDVLCGVLTGAAFAGGVADQYKVFDRPQNVGHFLMALRPGLFMAPDEAAARMARLVAAVKANPKADGVDEILMPGEPEARSEARRLREGIPYRRADLAPLVALARDRGVDVPPSLAAL